MLPALDAFEKYLHSPHQLPPLVRLGITHYQFEAIHPFADGNGRIGRLLISLLSCAWGLLPQPLLYLSVYFEANRQEYYARLLRVSQAGCWEEWLVFFLLGVKTQAQDGILRTRRLLDLRESYRARIQSERASARLLQVIDLLFERPILSIQGVSAGLDVHYPAAMRYVEQLEAEGILSEVTGRARNRVYRASEILEAIERPL
jgi:Fic family protein